MRHNFRSLSYRKLVENNKFNEDLEDLKPKIIHPLYTGIPESYGIFYAMGAALTLEGVLLNISSKLSSNLTSHILYPGVLSGCYHICPTAENFQFDTTFMYCISVLVFLKVHLRPLLQTTD